MDKREKGEWSREVEHVRGTVDCGLVMNHTSRVEEWRRTIGTANVSRNHVLPIRPYCGIHWGPLDNRPADCYHKILSSPSFDHARHANKASSLTKTSLDDKHNGWVRIDAVVLMKLLHIYLQAAPDLFSCSLGRS